MMNNYLNGYTLTDTHEFTFIQNLNNYFVATNLNLTERIIHIDGELGLFKD